MPEKPTDDEQTKNQETASVPGKANGGRKLFRWSLVIPLLLGAVVIVLIFGRDHLSSTFRSAKRAVSARQLGPFFTRVPADQLLSPDSVLGTVGRSPIDPGRVLSPELDKVGAAGSDHKPATGRDASTDSADRVAEDRTAPQVQGTQAPDASTRPSETPSPITPPTVEAREPGAPASPPPATLQMDGEKTEPARGAESCPTPPPAEHQGPTPTVGRFEDRDNSARIADKRPKKPAKEAAITGSPPEETPEASRTDQFQLPGSLMVKIHHYNGTVPKWGLMVILDDSATMGKKLKSWNPNRMQTAVEAVEKLSEALEKGSKIAVRDFLCAKGDGKPSPQGACLSHTLFEWTHAPFKGINDKLAQNTPSGKTNPCAAAAYALKKDFGSLGGLSPRLLLVTDGAHRCAFKEVLSEAEKRSGKEKITVDVLAFGMHRKRQAGYSKLAQRTNGMFLRIDSPGDLTAAIGKYTKLLKTPVKEKIEVRGEKTVLTANPDEAVTIVPGAYTIVLPAVAGINPSKRTLEPVQIQSGESTVVQVRVNKKGRPLAKVEPGTKAGKK